MNFLIDAQLPRRLAHWLCEAGHDGVHTRDLPLGNRTPDSAVNEIVRPPKFDPDGLLYRVNRFVEFRASLFSRVRDRRGSR